MGSVLLSVHEAVLGLEIPDPLGSEAGGQASRIAAVANPEQLVSPAYYRARCRERSELSAGTPLWQPRGSVLALLGMWGWLPHSWSAPASDLGLFEGK